MLCNVCYSPIIKLNSNFCSFECHIRNEEVFFDIEEILENIRINSKELN